MLFARSITNWPQVQRWAFFGTLGIVRLLSTVAALILQPLTSKSAFLDNAPLSWEPSTAWEQRLKDIMWTFDDHEPRFRHEKWRAVFDEQLKATPLTIQATAEPLFSLPLGEHVERWTTWLDKGAVWDRFRTISYVARLEGEELAVRAANPTTVARS